MEEAAAAAAAVTDQQAAAAAKVRNESLPEEEKRNGEECCIGNHTSTENVREENRIPRVKPRLTAALSSSSPRTFITKVLHFKGL